MKNEKLKQELILKQSTGGADTAVRWCVDIRHPRDDKRTTIEGGCGCEPVTVGEQLPGWVADFLSHAYSRDCNPLPILQEMGLEITCRFAD